MPEGAKISIRYFPLYLNNHCGSPVLIKMIPVVRGLSHKCRSKCTGSALAVCPGTYDRIGIRYRRRFAPCKMVAIICDCLRQVVRRAGALCPDTKFFVCTDNFTLFFHKFGI